MIKGFMHWEPQIDPSAWVAEEAAVVGRVTMKEESSVWYNCTVRGDISYVEIGRYTNIQDNTIIHEDEDIPCIIGDYVTVGHAAILHGCIVEDYCLIGMGSVVLDRALIGRGSVIGAGAVVPPGAVIPPYSVVMGVPGKVVKTLSPACEEERIANTKGYAERKEFHR